MNNYRINWRQTTQRMIVFIIYMLIGMYIQKHIQNDTYKNNIQQAIKCYQLAQLHKDAELIYQPKTDIYTCEIKLHDE